MNSVNIMRCLFKGIFIPSLLVLHSLPVGLNAQAPQSDPINGVHLTDTAFSKAQSGGQATIGLSSAHLDSDTVDIHADAALIESFINETGYEVVKSTDNVLLGLVKSNQGVGAYPGVDAWVIVELKAGAKLYGGLPGQSEYYSVEKSIMAADTVKQTYWEGLQVMPHPQFGYRPMVGVFELNVTTNVAIARTLANPKYGKGGYWQVFVSGFTGKLTKLSDITLK